MIRAIPSNASDNVYCTLLAQSAVHGAMSGFTGFTSGLVNGRHTFIPFNVSHGFLLSPFRLGQSFMLSTSTLFLFISFASDKFYDEDLISYIKTTISFLAAYYRTTKQGRHNRQDVG